MIVPAENRGFHSEDHNTGIAHSRPPRRTALSMCSRSTGSGELTAQVYQTTQDSVRLKRPINR
ncbi:hypothetical protein K443DRAFT_628975, partial [Laccaria amethystina LaAM-08-1]